MQEKQNPPKNEKKIIWEKEIICCVWENYVEWEREL